MLPVGGVSIRSGVQLRASVRPVTLDDAIRVSDTVLLSRPAFEHCSRGDGHADAADTRVVMGTVRVGVSTGWQPQHYQQCHSLAHSLALGAEEEAFPIEFGLDGDSEWSTGRWSKTAICGTDGGPGQPLSQRLRAQGRWRSPRWRVDMLVRRASDDSALTLTVSTNRRGHNHDEHRTTMKE